MKKSPSLCWRWRIIICILLLAFLTPITMVYSCASEKNDYSLIDDRLEGVLGDFNDILPPEMDTLNDPYSSSGRVGISFILESIFDTVSGERSALTSFFLAVFGLSMLMAFASNFDGEVGKSCKNAVFIVISAVLLDRVFDLIMGVGESLGEINTFFGSVIPIATYINAVGMSSGLAAAQNIGMSITLQIYSFLCGDFLYSLVGVMCVLSALSSIEDGVFGKISSMLKKTFLSFVGIITACVGATFSLQSIITSSADSGALRGAKYAISGMIPIVGGSISGALSTLAGGVAYMKGVVGGGAIAVIISLAIAPIISLLLYRWCFSISAFFLGICSQSGAEGVLNSFGFALDSVIAVYAMTVTVYVAQLAVFLKGGVPFA